MISGGGRAREPSEDSAYEQAEENFRSTARLEAEESEREAAQLAMRTRSLEDVAFDAMTRGDLIAVTVGPRTFTGQVAYSAGDLMTLEAGGTLVDFNLGGPISIRLVERARSGGLSRREGPGSFRGRLLEYEGLGRTAELGSVLFSEPLRGTVKVAARDHVLFQDRAGQEWAVPLAMVSYVAGLRE